MSIEEKLEKIRSPKLQNQRETAIVLSAVEETLKSQSVEPVPTAYFAALLALLAQSVSGAETTGLNTSLATAVVYLLDIFSAYVSPALLRSKFVHIVECLAPLLIPDNSNVDAPLLRPSIGCVESLLLAQDSAAWNQSITEISPRRVISSILLLARDHRPKVRKRAQEAIAKVLKTPPPSPSLDHPAAEMCAEAAMRAVSGVLASSSSSTPASKKDKKIPVVDEKIRAPLTHALQLVKTIAAGASAGWPSRKIEPLTDILLRLCRQQNEWLSLDVFNIFEAMFQGMAVQKTVATSKIPLLIQAVEDLRPGKEDERLVPSWVAVISRAYDVSAQISKSSNDSSASATEIASAERETFRAIPAIFTLVREYCTSQSKNIRVSASECLKSFLINCIPLTVIRNPNSADDATLSALATLSIDLLSVRYQLAWKEALEVLATAFTAYRWQTATYLRSAIRAVGHLREAPTFAGKSQADAVLALAIHSAGPAVVLEILPLNLIPSTGSNDQAGPGRAWLLPLLRPHTHNTTLAHFRTALMPLSETLLAKLPTPGTPGAQEATIHTKIYETLLQQIWATLPGYCTYPTDIPASFDLAFAETLAGLLYTHVDLRRDICASLQILVESLSEIVEMGERDDVRLTKESAKEALEHLAKGFAANFLAVLFNVYGKTGGVARMGILSCVGAWIGILSEEELLATFERVTSMIEIELKAAADGGQINKPQAGDLAPPPLYTLMDLMITMSIYLPRACYPKLFALAAETLPFTTEPQLQKKAYKLLPRLASSATGIAALQERNSELQVLLASTANSAAAAARRDRLDALAVVIENMPQTDLHFIPTVLSEVVLCCKEVNEKARTASFDLLILMAKKMSEGGTIQQNKIPHMETSTLVTSGSLEEFFTMVSAGLVGSSPHMVSASITAISRILFDFVDDLPPPLLQDLVQTMTLFLTSPNREIVRSVLGFAKIAIISLPDDIMRPHLEALIPSLLAWSKEHKARFRTKVKAMLERAIRRFGYDIIEKYTPEADRKLIQNIRKTRERRKRKVKEEKEAAADGSDAEATTDLSRTKSRSGSSGAFDNEYDDALYGSDDSDASDNEHSADEDEDRAPRKQKRTSSTMIAEGKNDPLDLLDVKSLGQLASSAAAARKRPATTAAPGEKKVFTHSAPMRDGKLVLGNAADADADPMALDNDDDAGTHGKQNGGGIGAYVEAITSRDAVQRGRGGRLKFDTRRKGTDRSVSFAELLDEEGEDDGDADRKGNPGFRGRGRGAGASGAGDWRGRGRAGGRGSAFSRGRGGSERGRGRGRDGGGSGGDRERGDGDRGRGGGGRAGGFQRGRGRGGPRVGRTSGAGGGDRVRSGRVGKL